MIRVLFICHGNICRSPMAEFIFRDLVEKEGLSHKIETASCATSREEIGNPVYPPAKRILLEHGIHCEGKRARQLVQEDYAYYDYLIAMENYNLRNMKKIIASDPQHKISRLLDFTSHPGDIDDPWYSGDFQTAYDEIYRGCQGLLAQIQSKLS